MSKNRVHIIRTESISAALDEMGRDISSRAYEISCGRNCCADPDANWFQAEHELCWKPPIELRQRNGAFELEALVAGTDPKHLEVQVSPQDILITGSEEPHDDTETTVLASEFRHRRLFRTVHLPSVIDPATVRAEQHDGVLTLVANVATSATPEVLG